MEHQVYRGCRFLKKTGERKEAEGGGERAVEEHGKEVRWNVQGVAAAD
jgi:hypothetical protein